MGIWIQGTALLIVIMAGMMAGADGRADQPIQRADSAMEETTGPTIMSYNPLFATALTNLQSYSYVHRALNNVAAQFKNPEYTTRGISLSVNVYQYHEFYIEVDVKEKGSVVLPKYSFRFLYQDSSTQAHNSFALESWNGLSKSQADQSIASLMDALNWNPTALPASTQQQDQLIAAGFQSQTLQPNTGQMDIHTVAVLPWNRPEISTKYAVVSYMTQGNLYADASKPLAVIFRFNPSGSVDVAENVWLNSGLEQPLSTYISTNSDKTMFKCNQIQTAYGQKADVSCKQLQAQADQTCKSNTQGCSDAKASADTQCDTIRDDYSRKGVDDCNTYRGSFLVNLALVKQN